MRFKSFVFLAMMGTPWTPPAIAAGRFGGTAAGADPGPRAPAMGTGVFVDGIELSRAQAAQLDALLGVPVPAGRYYIDARGMLGYEGGPPELDLRTIVAAHAGADDSLLRRAALALARHRYTLGRRAA